MSNLLRIAARRIKNLLGSSNPENRPHQQFSDHYSLWRQKRIDAIIKHYTQKFGESFFDGLKILEIGCGYGDIGGYLLGKGAIVTCSDARDEHLSTAKSRYPNLSVIQADLDDEWKFAKDFDLIISMGVLYHLKNYEQHLHSLATSGAKHVVLETEVADSDDPEFVLYTKEEGYDQAFNGTGCRPSPARIEQLLRNDKTRFERVTDDRCNAEFHVYDWEVKNSGTWRPGLRRFWFIELPPKSGT